MARYDTASPVHVLVLTFVASQRLRRRHLKYLPGCFSAADSCVGYSEGMTFVPRPAGQGKIRHKQKKDHHNAVK